MLTINENAPVKSSNLKTIMAVLSSVAVIGAATTYIVAGSSKSDSKGEHLSKFISDDMYGDFSFEWNGNTDFISNGHFSKSIDQNGEWDIEYYQRGNDDKDIYNSFVLKDAKLYKHHGNDTYSCQQTYSNNYGYAKYKYDLLNAKTIQSEDLTQQVYSQVQDVCEKNSDLYVLNNEDIGTTVICPSTKSKYNHVGVIARGFSGSVRLFSGKKKFEIKKDLKFPDPSLCEIADKFKSAHDLNVEELNKSLSKDTNQMMTTMDLMNLDSFPFTQSQRELDGRGNTGYNGEYEEPDREEDGFWRGAQMGAGDTNGPSGDHESGWTGDTGDTGDWGYEFNGRDSNPDGNPDKGVKGKNTKRKGTHTWSKFSSKKRESRFTSDLDCQILHGAGNQKGFYATKRKGRHNGVFVNNRWKFEEYSKIAPQRPDNRYDISAYNDTNAGNGPGQMPYNTRTYQPCWSYAGDDAIFVHRDDAHDTNTPVGDTPISAFKYSAMGDRGHDYRLTGMKGLVENKKASGKISWFPGYNAYWGNNLLVGNVAGIADNLELMGGCTWTTFSDHNSNQISYKHAKIQQQIATQICGSVGCTTGAENSYKALILGHSMGTCLTVATYQNGLWNKGPKATIALCAGPIKGSAGPVGLDNMCSGVKNNIFTSAVKGFLGTFINGWQAKGNNTFFPLALAKWALDDGKTCDGQGTGAIWVVKDLALPGEALQGSGTYTLNDIPTNIYMADGIYNHGVLKKSLNQVVNTGPDYYDLRPLVGTTVDSKGFPSYYSNSFIDHKMCGLSPDGLEPVAYADQITRLGNTGCFETGVCLQMSCPHKTKKNTHFVCHFRGCKPRTELSPNFKDYDCPRTSFTKYGWGKWVMQHDNHVSRHSCETDSRYYQGSLAQSGSSIHLSQANHKAICCKYGNGASVGYQPCYWYKYITDQALTKN